MPGSAATPHAVPSFYVSTAIDYVNAAPHIGHAYEKIAADVLARFQGLQGRTVFFLTGTDEHGQKVEKTARQHGLEPQAYVDVVSQSFTHAWQQLDIGYSRFIRTTDPDHYAVVAHLWQRLLAQDALYKAPYNGLYCTGCETFILPKDLSPETGCCPIHQTPPENVSEENWFFRLSRYRDAIRDYILAHPAFIQPEFRRQEVLHWLEEPPSDEGPGAGDLSVSRSVRSVKWGIPVPGDAEQRIYVWIDALSNYLTGIGYLAQPQLFSRFWPADVHLIGKDILRFHAIYWPAMLMAAELPLPKTIFAHGFITINASKISKSLGNVVDPTHLMARFSLPHADAVRYYLMTVAAFGQDGNFSEDDFKTRVNADLANNLGNLLNRTLTMTQKFCDGRVPEADTLHPLTLPLSGLAATEAAPAVAAAYASLAFQTAAELCLEWADACNKCINTAEPWALAKRGDEESLRTLAQVMRTVLEGLRQVAYLLWPICPHYADEIWRQLGIDAKINDTPWTEATAAMALTPGAPVQPGAPLLPRLESEIVGAAKKGG
jgi:methionyl-tRNA synthetase